MASNSSGQDTDQLPPLESTTSALDTVKKENKGENAKAADGDAVGDNYEKSGIEEWVPSKTEEVAAQDDIYETHILVKFNFGPARLCTKAKINESLALSTYELDVVNVDEMDLKKAEFHILRAAIPLKVGNMCPSHFQLARVVGTGKSREIIAFDSLSWTRFITTADVLGENPTIVLFAKLVPIWLSPENPCMKKGCKLHLESAKMKKETVTSSSSSSCKSVKPDTDFRFTSRQRASRINAMEKAAMVNKIREFRAQFPHFAIATLRQMAEESLKAAPGYTSAFEQMPARDSAVATTYQTAVQSDTSAQLATGNSNVSGVKRTLAEQQSTDVSNDERIAQLERELAQAKAKQK